MAPASSPGTLLLLLLLLAVWVPGCPVALSMRVEPRGARLEDPDGDGDAALLGSGRVKRGWVWNQFFVVEEYTGTEPLYVGKIHSDSDAGDGAIKYTISGEGAGSIFLIDELTGDIHATERLDREQKTSYTLRAQARDRQTGQLLEPESEFVIKVQDINDSEPRFLGGPYIGSVAELSPIGGDEAAPESRFGECVEVWNGLRWKQLNSPPIRDVEPPTHRLDGARHPPHGLTAAW
ncbi:Cadherin-22 [Varanus komodoensis]|nr:Cadherin-22 [Varanus komodoensis]